MEVASLIARFGVTGEDTIPRAADRAERSFNDLSKTADRTAPRVGGVFSTAAGFAGGSLITSAFGGVSSLIGGMLDANAQAETYRQSLEIAVGSQERATALFADVEKMASSTPFEFPELIQATTNLEAFGLSSQDWLTTIGDTAAATNKSVDQVTQAVLDAANGEFERLKELGVSTRVEGDKLTFSYMRNGQQITETVDKNNQEIINSTLQGIWSSKYEGAMDKQSRTFAGQYSTLRDNIRQTMMDASGSVFEFAKKGLGFANDIFAKGWKQAVTDTFGKDWASRIETAMGVFATAGEIAGAAIGVAGGLIAGAWDGIKAAWDRVSGPLTTVWDTFTALAGAMRDAFRDGRKVKEIIAELPGPLRTVAEPLLTMADSFGDLYRAWRDGGASGFFTQLKEEVDVFVREGLKLGSIAFSAAVTLAGELADVAADAGKWLWKKIGGWGGIVNAGTVTIDAALKLAENIRTSDLAASIGRAIVDGVTKLATLATDIGSAVKDKITSINWASVLTVDSFNLGEDLGVALRGAVGAAFGAGADVVRKLAEVDYSEMPGAIAKGIVLAASAAPAALLALSTGIASFVAGAFVGFAFGPDVSFSDVVDAVRGGLVTAFDAVTNFPSILVSKGKDLIQGILDGWDSKSATLSLWASNLPGWVAGKITGTLSALIGKGRELVQGLMDGWSERSEELAGWARNFGSWIAGAFPSWEVLRGYLFNAGKQIMYGAWLGLSDQWEDIKLWLGKLNPLDYLPNWHLPYPDFLPGGGGGKTAGYTGGNHAAFRPTQPTASAFALSPARARAGSGGTIVYDMSGSIIGGDVQRFVDARVAGGARKQVDSGYSRNRLAEARSG